MSISATGVLCLALNVYFEARGEDLASQYAVAEVTLNRVASLISPTRYARSCGSVSSSHGRTMERATSPKINAHGDEQ